MSDDAIAQLRRAISTPVNTMTVVMAASSKQARDILCAVVEDLHERPWRELPMPCTEGAVGTLLRTARQLTEAWPPEAGVLFLLDDTPPNRPPASGIEFWRAMNLQRENWASLNCHLVFILTLQNYEQLLVAADHLASWIPIKLDARPLKDATPMQEILAQGFMQPSEQSREEARQRLEELEHGLAATLAEGKQDAPMLLLRRYYLPMMEAALNANELERADTIRKRINAEDVPEPDKPRWWRATCDTLLRLYHLEEAQGEAEKYLSWAEHAKNDREAAEAHGKLGEVLYTRGDLAGAQAHFERALKIDEAAFGPEHPNVAIRINNLGGVLLARRDLPGARAHYERALRIDEAFYGPEHPNVAIRINNLGGVLHDLGDLAGARDFFERALNINEIAYGPEHSNVAICTNNLGLVLKDLGDLAGARVNFERALKIFEQHFGKYHPHVATTVNNQGGVLQELGDLAGAREHYERALKIDEAAYGPEHPEVATDINNLGGVLKDLGDLAGARACFERALAIRRRFLGADHPKTKQVARNLAALGE